LSERQPAGRRQNGREPRRIAMNRVFLFVLASLIAMASLVAAAALATKAQDGCEFVGEMWHNELAFKDQRLDANTTSAA
jgi:hypothetical protein